MATPASAVLYEGTALITTCTFSPYERSAALLAFAEGPFVLTGS